MLVKQMLKNINADGPTPLPREKKTGMMIANWKMNPKTLKEARALFTTSLEHAQKMRGLTTVMAVPFPYVVPLGSILRSRKVAIAVQDVSLHAEGAHTGQVSASMASSVGAKYAIIGHSERRALGETNKDVHEKVRLAFKNNLRPIVCIGEVERDEDNNYLEYLRLQVESIFKGLPKAAHAQVILAYEPVWALSSTEKRRDATPEDVFEMVIYIKKIMRNTFRMKNYDELTVLYGGSAHAKNTRDFLERGGVDGLLAGRASLDGDEFGKMLEIARKILT